MALRARRLLGFVFLLAGLFLLVLPGCDRGSSPPGTDRGGSGGGPAAPSRLELGFVVNNPSDFWILARAGIRKAEREFNVAVDYQVPGQGTPAQQRQIIESLIAKGVKGMAVSVLDPRGAIGILNDAAKVMPVVTQDSDCPESNRVAYIGTDNVEAGRVAGAQIKKALPEGGKIALFVGKLDVANARERKQGIEEAIQGTKIEIVESFTDEGNRATAQTNVRNALDKYPDLKCLVGLWSYNAPAIIKVVKEKGLAGKIKIVAFDEETPTLDGIDEGIVESTVIQQPYEFGYQSIRALAKLARKEDAGLPANGLAYVPVRVIDKGNVKEFRTKVDEWMREGRG
jgi:ribose transport system substrate-binding protein